MSEFNDIISEIGDWKMVDAVSSCKIGNSILTQTLLKFFELYPSRRLRTMSDKKFQFLLNEHGLYDKTIQKKKKTEFMIDDLLFTWDIT